MIGKDVKDQKTIGLWEVKKIMDKRKEESPPIEYEQQDVVEYYEEFLNIKTRKANEKKKKLMELGIPEEVAINLLEVLPKEKQTIKVILNQYDDEIEEDSEIVENTYKILIE